MAPRQFELMERPARKLPRLLMHVRDAGGGEYGGHVVQFECRHCGHVSEWLTISTVTEAKRGLPCPRCN